MSFLAYANDALVINQWSGITNIECEQFSRCLSTGDNVLDYLHIKPVKHTLVFVYNIIICQTLKQIFFFSRLTSNIFSTQFSCKFH